MENNSPHGLGEQFLRGSHLTMQRDSWSEEIDPLRSDAGRNRWSENEDNLQSEIPHTLEGENLLLDRDSLSEEEDQPMKPIERDRQSIPAIADTVGFEFMGRHHPVRSRYERERVVAQDYDPPYEGDSLSIENSPRGGYERAYEPGKGCDRLAVDRAHTMKDFEKQITELKKENFNLKLRIYFLEEQVQRHCDNSSEELHRMNIELKVEVESLKHEYQEKQNLLIRASKAMESLAGEHNVTIQQLKNDHLKQLQDLGEASRQKLQLLEELKHEKAELEKVCVLLDQERMQRFNAEERLLAVKEQYNKSMGILEERDWIIQCLNETLRSKDALITQLEKQIHTMMPSDASNGNATKTVTLLPESDLQEGRSQSPGLTCRDCLATKSSDEKEENANEWQKKVKEMGNIISELQQKVEESKAGLANEERNAVKRDKAIQGLTLALKKKTKENEKLLKEIENLNATLAGSRVPALRDQSLRKDSDPDYKKLIITIQAQQDLCSRLHEYERESGSLQKELDAIVMLRKWLERDIQSNQELRKILEAQIMAKYRESDTMSFLGDQTTYLSICLDHLDENNMMEAVNRALVKASETQTVLKNSSLTEESLNKSQDSNLELSVIEKDAKDESAAAVATHPKHEFTEPSQSTVSSSTQTTLKYYADQAILVDGFAFGKETSESIKNRDEEILSNAESSRFTSDVHKSHNDKQQKCFSNNLTKSRIPVLLKSPLRKRIKTETFLTSRENDHVCLEKELQEENNRLLEELACAKLEIGALKSNKGTPQGWDDSDSAGIEPLRPILQDLQAGRLSGLNEHVCLEKELQEENSKLLEQLECAKLDIKALQSYKEKSKVWDYFDNAGNEPSRLILQGDLHAEGLSGINEHVCLENELKEENHILLEQLASAKLEIKAFNSHKEKPKGTPQGHDDSDNAGNEPTRQSLQGELQAERLSGLNEHVCLEKELKEENHKLLEQLACAKLEIKALKSNKEIPTQGWDESNHAGNESWRPILQGDLQAERLSGLNEHAFLEKELQEENSRLLEQLSCAKLEIKALKLNQEKGWDNSQNEPSRQILQEDLQAERLSGLNQHICLEKELQEENSRLLEQLESAKLEIKALKLSKEKGWDNSDNAWNEPSRLILQGDPQAGRLSGLNEHVCLERELQEENRKLLEELACAKLEIGALKSNMETPKGRDDSDNAWNDPTRLILQGDLQTERLSGLNEHVCLDKELQEENHKLLEELACAKLEIRALKSNKCWDNSDQAGNEPSRLNLQGNLQAERLSGLSGQLKYSQIEVGKLQTVENAIKGTEFACKLEKAEKEKMDFFQQGFHKELQLINDKSALDYNHSSNVSEITNNSALDNADIAERDLSAQSLYNELQLENLRLAEQLKSAQMDIERLQSREVHLQNKNAQSGLDCGYKEEDVAVRTLIKELQMENQRLVEQFKCAQVEIEMLREEKASVDNSFRLDNVDAEDRDSEHSFIDKTITNTINLSEIHNGNPDFELQVNSHNFTCQNFAGLCCHHEQFCIECANNQETLIFQSSSFKKVSTIQKECKLLTVSQSHRPFEDTSLSKYDLLVQSQARELSHQRQRIKESHNLSVVCSKNFINVIKAFEDLILTASLDSNIALGFQEQLAQTVEWLKELEYKLSDAYYGEDDANSDHSADSLLYTPSRLVPGHKMWADKHGCHVLGLVEDYNALRKQILEAKTVLEETEAFLDHGVQTAVLNMTEHFGNIFFEKFNRTKQSLEEASCLLKLLWRVSLPMQTHSSYNIRQVEETNLEMTQLRKRVLEQDKLLSGMVKRVYSENQMKEDIEKVILNQLAMTHKILKRAKGNLAVQVVDKQ
ncbi:protein Daple-like [Rana temporaria]|uniref:protein Daple-like n=1 Tax=Rana temporaria TaxID=8407 RepID=UPI001AAE15A7|nr:protein Daple-like [Rana temporaria]